MGASNVVYSIILLLFGMWSLEAESSSDPWVNYWYENIDSIDDKHLKSDALTQIGRDLLEKGLFDLAKQTFEEARDLRMDLREHDLVKSSTINIAAVFIKQDLRDEAINVLRWGAEYESEGPMSHVDFNLHNLLSTLYLQQERYSEALMSARIAIEGYRSYGQWEKQSDMLFMESITLYQLGDHSGAEKSIRRSFELYRKRADIYRSDEYLQKANIRLRTAEDMGIDVEGWNEVPKP